MANTPESSTKIIYSMVGVSKRYEKKDVLKDIYLSYFYGAKIGVLGLNGSGKSSLLRILSGDDKEFEGQIQISPGYTVGFIPQEPKLDENATVREIVTQGAKATLDLLEEFNTLSDQMAEPMSDAKMNKMLERQGNLQEKLEAANAWELDSHLEHAMDALRCPPPESKIGPLSGGERRRVALCRLLIEKPDILLLDEPTNHLDAESVAWLEEHLRRYEGTVIAVTHDRYFLDNVATWILELDRGSGIPWKGNYTSWLEQKGNRLAVEEKQESNRQKALKRELEWVRKSPQARQSKSKARLEAYDKMVAEQEEARASDVEIYIPPGPHLGQLVIEAKGLAKSYGDRLLFENVSFSLPPNGIVGIIGPNGAGKTTLFRILAGAEKPDAGTLRVADSVQLAYVDQARSVLDDKLPVWSAISDGAEAFKLGKMDVNARAYAARFSFTGSDQQQTVGTLSGGQRGRVHLARVLRSGANVLLLDEPTNDLDVNTMRALEDALERFAGCAVVISHDRWFLDRLATHILAFEGDSQVTWFEGNFTAYEDDRKRRMGVEADQPHRIKYRALTRG
ncbi:MAG: energy-dependent translational throttle protein EttA [Planctomycetota bacterium]|nr:energy-dependent translational throttle protein EttA [Planctomycetota bacterium]